MCDLLWLRFVLNVSENSWGTLMFRLMFTIVQAHGLSCPYRVGRRTTLNSLTSTKGSIREISAFLRQFDRQNARIDANPFDRKMLNEEIYQI